MLLNFNHLHLSHAREVSAALIEDHQATDRLMLGVLALHWLLAATAIGYMHGFYLAGFVGGGVIFSLALAAHRLLAGTLYVRLILALSLALFSMLFIQLSLGRVEIHFHIFVALAILARYKDARPIATALVAVLVHHLALNVCQQMGVTVFGVPLTLLDYGTGLDIVLFLHGVPAIAETVVLSLVIYQLRRQYCEDLDKALDNAEVIAVLERVITDQDATAKLAGDSRYAPVVNELLSILSANATLRDAVDKASTNLIHIDPDGRVLNSNSSAERLFEGHRDALAMYMEGYEPAQGLAGTDLNRLLSAASVQLASDRKDEQILEIALPGFELRVRANSVCDARGRALGFVTEWQDRTLQNQMEAEISNIVDAAESGDLSQRIQLAGKTGFFARISDGINRMIGTVERSLDDLAAAVEKLSNGELDSTFSTDLDGRFAEVSEGMTHTLSVLSDMVSKIRNASSVVEQSAHRIASGGENLASRTASQATSLEETVASIEEMTNTVHQIAESTVRASELSNEGAKQANDGGRVISATIAAMGDIHAASEKIANIISIIDGIAFQTNLLALNAAVEAARAGEQGKGFAVVANEVQSLAHRSAEAAKEIKDLISDSMAKVEGGSELADESGAVLKKLVSTITEVSDLMSNVAKTNGEHALGIELINANIIQIDKLTQQNADLVAETASAGDDLSRQAGEMSALMSFFGR